MIAKAEEGIRYTLANASSTGVLGNKAIESMWPMCVYFRVLQAYYERTGDPAIPAALERHYMNFTQEQVEKWRNIVSIEGMLWTYDKTGNAKLLDICERAYNGGKFGDLTPAVAAGDERFVMHGVTCMEELKLPMLLYAYTGKRYYLDLALNAERKLTRDHMLPDGVPASAEALVGNGNVINSHETCDISDYTWTLEQFLLTTGEVRWADKIEKAVFNAGLGAVTKDFRSLQYFSSVHQVIATNSSTVRPGWLSGRRMKRSAAPETFTVSCPITSHICGYAGKTALLPLRSTDLRLQRSTCRTADSATSHSGPPIRSTGRSSSPSA